VHFFAPQCPKILGDAFPVPCVDTPMPSTLSTQYYALQYTVCRDAAHWPIVQ